MPIVSRFRARQGELFTPPVPHQKLPQEAYQRILQLLAKMMNEHLEGDHHPHAQGEVGDE